MWWCAVPAPIERDHREQQQTPSPSRSRSSRGGSAQLKILRDLGTVLREASRQLTFFIAVAQAGPGPCRQADEIAK